MNTKIETCRFVETHCKFCKAQVRLKMFDGCTQFFGNPDRFVSLAACNRCADYMEKRRGLIQGIVNAAWIIATEGAKKRDAAVARIEKLLGAFARLVADFSHCSQPSIYGLAEKIESDPMSARKLALSLEPM